jgi:hypothetical protein
MLQASLLLNPPDSYTCNQKTTSLQRLETWIDKGCLIGIVFLMTNKPSFIGAIITVLMAVVIGLASGLPWWRKEDGRMHHHSQGRL